MKRNTLLKASFCLLISINSTAQSIYQEDFKALVNGSTSDNGPTAWSTDASWCTPDANDIWSVQDGEFVAKDLDCEAKWESATIDISAYTAVDVSAVIRGTSSLDANGGNADFVKGYYKLDGGPQQLWFEDHGQIDAPTVASCSGLSGSSIQLIFYFQNNSDNEYYYLDNISVAVPVSPPAPGQNMLFAIADGNWNDGNTWSATSGGTACNCIPDPSIDVHIECGYTVFMNADADARDVNIYNGGQLQWSSNNDELNIWNGGDVTVHAGGLMYQNGKSNAELEFESASASTLKVDGVIDLDDIDINSACTLTIEGAGHIDLSDDFEVVASATIDNQVTGLIQIQDDLRLAAAGIQITNSGELRIDDLLNLSNADNGLLENRTSGSIRIGNDIKGSENTDQFVVRNEGIITIEDDIKGSPSGANACSFYNLSNATLELGHNNNERDWKIFANYSGNTFNYDRNGNQNRLFVPEDAYWNLVISGSGTKRTRGDLAINGSLAVTDDAIFDVQNQQDSIHISGDWNISSINGNPFRNSNAYITFNGTTDQYINGVPTAEFEHLIIASSGNVYLNSDVLISEDGSLTLTSGIIQSNANAMLRVEDDVTVSQGNALSYVQGPVEKTGDDAFVFPLGKNGHWARLGISAPADDNTVFRATYFDVSPDTEGYSIGSHESSINNVSHKEFWKLERLAGNDNVQVTLHWDDAANWSFINSLPDLKVVQFDSNSGQWIDLGNGGTTGTTGAGAAGSIQGNVTASSFGAFTFGSGSGAVNSLPVELLSFDAKQVDEVVELRWTTATEHNNDKFKLQRSVDNQGYETILEVKGAGNSSQIKDYRAIDENPLENANYYRLVQVDFDGTSTTSDVEMVNFISAQSNGLLVWPNPISEEATVVFSPLSPGKQVYVEILSSLGTPVHTQIGIADQDGVLQQTLHIPYQQESGVYLLRVSAGDKMETCRIIIK